MYCSLIQSPVIIPDVCSVIPSVFQENLCAEFPHQLRGILPVMCCKSGSAKNEKMKKITRSFAGELSVKDLFLYKKDIQTAFVLTLYCL